MNAPVGRTVQPSLALAVEVGQIHEGQPGPEVAAHVAHTRLDLAFGLRPVRLAGLGSKSVVVGKVRVARVPVNRSYGPLACSLRTIGKKMRYPPPCVSRIHTGMQSSAETVIWFSSVASLHTQLVTGEQGATARSST